MKHSAKKGSFTLVQKENERWSVTTSTEQMILLVTSRIRRCFQMIKEMDKQFADGELALETHAYMINSYNVEIDELEILRKRLTA